MKTLIRWLRRLIASRFVSVTLLISFIVTGIVLIPIGAMILAHQISWQFLTLPLLACVMALAFGYGVVRSLFFHPAFDKDYCQWLANTPWTPEYPLAKGPVHLVWQDGAVLGGFVICTALLALTIDYSIGLVLLGPVIAFSIGLTLSWTMVNIVCGELTVVYTVFAIPPAFSLLPFPPSWLIVVPIVMAPVAWIGIRRTLKTFPWDDKTRQKMHSRQSQSTDVIIGWPFHDLLEPVDEFFTTRTNATAEALIAAGWILLLAQFATESDPHDDRVGVFMLAGVGSVVASGWRMVRYSPVICSKLCWGLRIARKRWIIPQHDQILIAPLLVLAIGWVLPSVLLDGFALSASLSLAITVAIVVFIARSMGPSIRELRLTGVHSMGPALIQPTSNTSNRSAKA